MSSSLLIASGDFRLQGGMDRPNYEFAWHWAERLQRTVHVVAFQVDPPLASHRNVIWHRVAKPLGRYSLGLPRLRTTALRLQRTLRQDRIFEVSNGGVFPAKDLNWVHYVHAAWPPGNTKSPSLKTWLQWRQHRQHCRQEAEAFASAKLVVVNSRRTGVDVQQSAEISSDRIHVVYYGIDPPAFRIVSEAEKLRQRRRFGLALNRPLAIFVGAIGHDDRKGVGCLIAAWQRLCRQPNFHGDLLVLGSGSKLNDIQRQIATAGLQQRIRLLGYQKNVAEWLAAADVLVAPTKYEAYGQGVHEALCCGVPAVVSARAGVAERYSAALRPLLLDDIANDGAADDHAVQELVRTMCLWQSGQSAFRNAAQAMSRELQGRTWQHMAEEVTSLLMRSDQQNSVTDVADVGGRRAVAG